jgi:dTDP-L-rhamnose 4-epimerase
VADVSRARQLLGFRPRIAWEDGVDELVRWCRDTRAVDGFARAAAELAAHGLVTDRLTAGHSG